MEIYLLTDVKGKGKIYDKINVADGFANFLIKEKKAIQATKENTDYINAILLSNKIEEDLKNKTYSDIIERLGNRVINIQESLTPKGSLQKDLTKKKLAEIVTEYLLNNFDYKADQNIISDGIKLKSNIKTTGKHEIIFQLSQKHKSVFYVIIEDKE